jgi:hypothetical protein
MAHGGIWPKPASRRHEAAGKLVGEHDDDEGNSIWCSGEEVLTGEELSTAASLGQMGTVMVARCGDRGCQLQAWEASWGQCDPRGGGGRVGEGCPW